MIIVRLSNSRCVLTSVLLSIMIALCLPNQGFFILGSSDRNYCHDATTGHDDSDDTGDPDDISDDPDDVLPLAKFQFSVRKTRLFYLQDKTLLQNCVILQRFFVGLAEKVTSKKGEGYHDLIFSSFSFIFIRGANMWREPGLKC